MADRSGSDPKTVLRTIRGPLALTRLGMIAEQVLRAFWPFFTLVMLLLGGLMLGLHDVLPVEVVWAGVVSGALALLVTLGLGARRLHWPSRDEALSRLDGTLKGRPIRALLDDQVIGRDDTASAAVWRAHQARMADRAATARSVSPDLRLSERDPYALRYVAALALVCGLLFGSVWRLNSMSEMTPGAVGLAETASWEGWVEPPRYTGRPTIYLNDVTGPDLNVPQGSRIILRLYGPVGALSVSETVSGRIGEIPPASEQAQDFTIAQDGEIRIDGTGGQSWAVSLLPDTAPESSGAGPATAEAAGDMNLPYTAKDDYGIVAGEAVIELDLAALDRRFGLVTEPEPRETITVPLPLPFSGDRTEFTETFIEDFSKHPWAHLPVRITLSAEDAAGQTGVAEAFTTNLPARRFFDPLAAAIIEQRRDLMWSRENVMPVSQVLRAISYRRTTIPLRNCLSAPALHPAAAGKYGCLWFETAAAGRNRRSPVGLGAAAGRRRSGRCAGAFAPCAGTVEPGNEGRSKRSGNRGTDAGTARSDGGLHASSQPSGPAGRPAITAAERGSAAARRRNADEPERSAAHDGPHTGTDGTRSYGRSPAGAGRTQQLRKTCA